MDAASTEVIPTTQAPHFHAYATALAAEAAVCARRPDSGERIAAALPLTRDNDYAAAYLARAEGRLHGSAEKLERAVELWSAVDARFEIACTLLQVQGGAAEGQRELQALGCTIPSA